MGLDLIDSAFSLREATLCFLMSRMWCIDDGTLRARVKMTHLVRSIFDAPSHPQLHTDAWHPQLHTAAHTHGSINVSPCCMHSYVSVADWQ